MDIGQLLATWLHTVAFVIAWGYYGVLARMILPGLERSVDLAARPGVVVAIERRALPLVLGSMIIFIATGTYLLVVNPHYAGLGDVFDSTWTTLMFVKHGLVVVLVALGVLVDVAIRGAGEATTDADRAAGLRRIHLETEILTGLGALIALLTVAAQLAT